MLSNDHHFQIEIWNYGNKLFPTWFTLFQNFLSNHVDLINPKIFIIFLQFFLGNCVSTLRYEHFYHIFFDVFVFVLFITAHVFFLVTFLKQFYRKLHQSFVHFPANLHVLKLNWNIHYIWTDLCCVIHF